MKNRFDFLDPHEAMHYTEKTLKIVRNVGRQSGEKRPNDVFFYTRKVCRAMREDMRKERNEESLDNTQEAEVDTSEEEAEVDSVEDAEVNSVEEDEVDSVEDALVDNVQENDIECVEHAQHESHDIYNQEAEVERVPDNVVNQALVEPIDVNSNSHMNPTGFYGRSSSNIAHHIALKCKKRKDLFIPGATEISCTGIFQSQNVFLT